MLNVMSAIRKMKQCNGHEVMVVVMEVVILAWMNR